MQGQRYDASGAPIGGEFQVNTYTTELSVHPSVASDAAGNFVVVWESDGSAGSDTSGSPSRASATTRAAARSAASSRSTPTRRAARAARRSRPTPRATSSWSGRATERGRRTALPTSVQGQRYDASGAPLGGEFQVNTYTTGNQVLPSVASDAAGNFVVVWAERRERRQRHVRLLRPGPALRRERLAVGGEFQVNTYTTGNRAPVGRERRRGQLRRRVGELRERGRRHSGAPCTASATTRAALRRREFQVNTYTTYDSSSRRSRATPRATSSWSGTATEAPTATHPTSPCRPSATCPSPRSC